MISTTHTFTVFHPKDHKLGITIYEEKEFGFSFPVSRMRAREIVERVEGYVIQRKQREKRIIQRVRKNKVQGI